jgi:hypothetical protein
MSSYVDELKSFAGLHAKAQGVDARTLRAVLGRVDDDGDGPRSWVHAWSEQARRAEGRGRDLAAAGLYGLARFPFVNGPAREAAHRGSVAAFERWRVAAAPGVRRTVASPAGTFTYVASTSAPRGAPVLIVIGGIVSPKEQWGQMLGLSRRIGMTVAVTEMPGVGENTLRYTPESATQLSALLDDLQQVTGARCIAYALAFSFGGHLAMRCALDDARIRGIATVGAPIDAFFAIGARWPTIPSVTRRTMEHLTGVPESALPRRLPDWRLTADELGRLSIPIRYVASARDEIIPAADPAALAHAAPDVGIVTFDDVHGSPAHLAQVRAWLALSLLRMRGVRGIRPLARRTMLRLRGVHAHGEGVA